MSKASTRRSHPQAVPSASHYRKPRRARPRRSLEQILLTCRPQIDLQMLLLAYGLDTGIAMGDYSRSQASTVGSRV